VLANYAPATALLHDASGKVCGARLAPALPVPGAPAEPEIEVRASAVVSATGVWADDVRALDEAHHPHSIRPAKGIHVTVPAAALPADIAAVVPVAGDRRSIFVVPWPDGEDVYVGTTDTDWDGGFDDPACLPEDVDYLLAAVNKVVTRPIAPSEVTGVWAGLRPLLRGARGHHVSSRTADMSRRHTVSVSETGMVSVTGGKLTTYRLMAEDAVNAAVSRLGASARAGTTGSPTRRLPLLGAAGLDELRAPGTAASLGVDEPTFAALLRRHGDETPQVLALAEARPELLQPLVPGLAQLEVEALWAVREEMALTLDDVLSRRTRARLRRAEPTAGLAGPLGKRLAGEWGRGVEAVQREADALAADIRAEVERGGVATGTLPPAAAVPDLPGEPARSEGSGR